MADKIFSILTAGFVLAAIAVALKPGSALPGTIGSVFTGETNVIGAAEKG